MSQLDLSLPPGLRDPSRRILRNAVVKDEVEVLKYSHETNGAYTEMRVRVAPGGGTPIHCVLCLAALGIIQVNIHCH